MLIMQNIESEDEKMGRKKEASVTVMIKKRKCDKRPVAKLEQLK